MICVEDSEPQLSPALRAMTPPPSSQMTVFCDLDGPLIDVSERYYQTYQLGLIDTQATYQAQGMTLPLQVLSKKQFWRMKQDRTPDSEIALRSGLQSEQITFFLERVHQIVNQPALLQKDQLQPGVRWSLILLRAWGVRLAVVTLRNQIEAVQILQDYGLAHLFSSIQGTQDGLAAYRNYTEYKKELLADMMGQEDYSQAESIWMIGDTEADILAGQAMGISTIAVTCGIRSMSYLNQLQPTRIHHDLFSATHYLLGVT
jgi:phosphoglycolate phosphatase-like HAD superfamily hydrolase